MPASRGVAEHVAGREMGDPEIVLEPLGLRPFSSTRRPKEHDAHEYEVRVERSSSGFEVGSQLPLTLRPRLARLLFQQPLVIPHHQVAIDFLHQVEGHADGDQQAGAAVEAGDHVIDVEPTWRSASE